METIGRVLKAHTLPLFEDTGFCLWLGSGV